MIRTNRWMFSLIGLGLVALALVLATPRAVHAVVAALVQVTNTAASPVIASNMDDPGRIPYQAGAGNSCGSFSCADFFSPVPANHRLVIQHVSVGGSAAGPGVVQLVLKKGGQGFSSFFVPTALTGTVYSFAQDEPTLFFVDGGDSPILEIDFYGGSATISSANVTLSGYLLDCAAAPCSAIAH